MPLPRSTRRGRPTARRIAFSTDRFTTNLETIKPGELRLATMDIASGAVTELGGFDDAKNISPQWTADGRSLYFISDRQGISNIYRMEVAMRARPTQLTNMLTGASGITALSPAMSFAGGRLVFSAYENDGYNIYALETAEQLAGEPSIDLPRNAAVLPPRREAGGLVVEALAGSDVGPAASTEVADPRGRTVQAEAGASTSSGSRRSASVSIRSAPMRPAASRCSSATCSAIT